MCGSVLKSKPTPPPPPPPAPDKVLGSSVNPEDEADLRVKKKKKGAEAKGNKDYRNTTNGVLKSNSLNSAGTSGAGGLNITKG